MPVRRAGRRWPRSAPPSACCCPCCPARPAARATEGADRTLSPYFVVDQATPGVDALPLKSTQVDVKVSGVIADVRVTQRYRNEGSTPIEARYVFPASTRAAVTAMTMRIGDRVVQAQIREKQAARREYEGAKREGKSASLLEQHRPNVFQMSIANVMPGDEIAVDLRYSETHRPDRRRVSLRVSDRGRATLQRCSRDARAINPSPGSPSPRCAPACRPKRSSA